MNRALCIDFETTGVDPKTCEPVEVALLSNDLVFEQFIWCQDIPAETSAVHHIVLNDVADSPTWEEVKQTLVHHVASEPLTVLVAHNAEYEKTILGDFTPVLWVCTYKCALRIWPDAPNHKNETLRYWLNLGRLGRIYNQQTHSALHDCRVTWLIFQKMLETVSLEQLIKWTELPAQLPRMPMGKHFGQAWDTIPGPYLQWVVNQTEMRPDVKYCAQEELTKRRNNHATHRSG